MKICQQPRVIRMGVRKVLIMESRKVEKWKTRTLPLTPPYRAGSNYLQAQNHLLPAPVGEGQGWGQLPQGKNLCISVSLCLI